MGWNAALRAGTFALVDVRTWPLSAAATQLLLGMDAGSATDHRVIARLAVKELVLRGHLRIDEVKKRRWRSTVVRISRVPAAAATLPPPLETLGRAFGDPHQAELSAVIRLAVKRDTRLFTKRLKEESLAALEQQGLAEQRERRSLGLFRTRSWALTSLGRDAAQMARAGVERASALADGRTTGPADAEREAADLGLFVLLAPAGIGVASKIALRRRARRGGDGGAVAIDDVDTGQGFHLFHGCDDAFGGLFDGLDAGLDGIDAGLDSTFDSIDAAMDSVGSSIDAGIDSGVSDGGGDGGGGDGGGGGCGGGGD